MIMEIIDKKHNILKIWRKVKLGKVADLNPSVRLKKGKSYSFIPMEIIDGSNKYIKPSTKKRFDGGGTKFSEGDVLFARITPCLEHGKVAVAKRLEEGVGFGSTEYFIFRGKENVTNTDFLYYISKINKFRQTAINSMVGASGRQRARIEAIQNYELNLPTITEQKRIASILSTFDNKIELNNKINQNLEQMVQVVFKEWFIKFKFPGYKKVKSIDSELGKIPKGWVVKNVEEIINFEKGVEPGSAHYIENKKQGFVPFYRVRDLDKQNGVDVYIPKEVTNGKICSENDILLSLDATVGRVKFGCNGAFSSGIRKVYSKDSFIKNSFIYFWLKTPYVQNTILEHASGTTIFHAGSSIKFLKILYSEKIIRKFQKISDPIFNKILEINKENQKLTSLRDLFLPKLMNGEIRVRS